MMRLTFVTPHIQARVVVPILGGCQIDWGLLRGPKHQLQV